MKIRRSMSIVMALVFCLCFSFSALAKAQNGADIWVGYNSKYSFYLNSNGSMLRIDKSGKEKVLLKRKEGFTNISYCDEKYVYVTGDTSNFKKLPTDAEDEETQYGPIHIDLIRVDAETGSKKTILSNLRQQSVDFDKDYLYYSPDSKDIYRAKHDGTSAKKYMSLSNYYEKPYVLQNGSSCYQDWEKEKITITNKSGAKKTVSGIIEIVTDKYIFAWVTAKDYKASLVRYDLSGSNAKNISSMKNTTQVDFGYDGNYLYFVAEGASGLVVKKMDMNGKLATFKSLLIKDREPYFPGVYIANNWLFLYDDVESGGYWGEYIGKMSLK